MAESAASSTRTEPEVWSLAQLAGTDLSRSALWCSARFREQALEELEPSWVETLGEVPPEAQTLIVLGGGTRIDEAKYWRFHQRPELRLIAIASIWGSGAEVSPVVALTRPEGKLIEMEAGLVPDVRVRWPELARSLPEWRAREACGDAWSHALEGFLSPLASDELRSEGALLLADLSALSMKADRDDAAWFEASVRACRLQARSSVGLVHGLAHVLEGALADRGAERPFGHARLCSLFLAPVIALDRCVSSTCDELLVAHGVDIEAIERAALELHDAEAYATLLPVLAERWRDVLRDRCTRTNVALVRPAHLSLLEAWRP